MLFRSFARLLCTALAIVVAIAVAVAIALAIAPPHEACESIIKFGFPVAIPSPGWVCLTTAELELDDGYAIRHRLAHDTLPLNLSRAISFARGPFLPHCTASACIKRTPFAARLCFSQASSVRRRHQPPTPAPTAPNARPPFHAMARTFKFPFPLPSRKQHSDSYLTSLYDPTDLPLVSPGSKAERVLGTSDSGVKAGRRPSGSKEKNSHKQTEYVSVTVLDTDGLSPKSAISTAEIPFHLHSFPLPRKSHMENAAEWDARSATETSRIPPRSESSSTLQSYYDSSKSPLSISQQTSASSARDMALRKGYPSVISPAPKVSEIDGTPSTPTENDKAKKRGKPKHLNLQFDLSSLFHKPDGPVQPILSPNHIVTSPSPVSIGSAQRSRPKLFLWERKKSKESWPGGVEGPRDLPNGDENAPVSARTHLNTSPEIVGNRLNNVAGDRLCSDGLPYRPLSQNLESPAHGARADSSRRHRLRRSKSSISELSEEQEKKCSNRARAHSTSLPRDIVHLHPQQRGGPEVAAKAEGSASGHQARENSTIIFPTINIHEHSFLTLSSSDEENEVRGKPTDPKSRRHRIRASVDKADFAGEVVVCSAQRLTHVKPRPVVNPPRRRISRMKEPDSIPPVPSIPAITPRISSIRWREEAKNFLPVPETGSNSQHSRQSSRTSCSASHLSPLGSQRKPLGHESKIMAVTAEEEKLLEAMRRKRASIRQEILAAHMDELNLVQHHMKSCFRPKTASVDGPYQPSYFHSERSVSPSLASGSMVGCRTFSAATSVDGILHDEPSFLRSAASLCKCPTRSSSPGGARWPSTMSSDSAMPMPTLSFNPSDILPSTPAMSEATEEEMHGAAPRVDVASPLTPPLDHGALDVYSTDLTVEDLSPHSEPILGVNGHGLDRKQPVGSSIIVLDGTGRHSRELMEDNGMTSWAADRW